MLSNRKARAKINIIVSLGCQIVTIICGLITPKLMLEAYGSEAYGATTSIAQFLSYITLLEGGIGGVARAVLYKPLAQNDFLKISGILIEIKTFFRRIAYVFILYAIILASSFKEISGLEVLNWTSTFGLVLVIAVSTFVEYYLGISYSVLLQAAHKVYITNLLSIFVIVANTIGTIILVNMKCSLIFMKLVTSLIFIIKPIALYTYVKKHFELRKDIDVQETYLKQKWTGLAQHMAYFLHSNTDVIVLTIFKTLEDVSIYAVYNMIVSNIRNLTMSFVSGMEALFGDMLAKKELNKLNRTFDNYENLISVVSITLFSITAVLIVPFVKLYTVNVKGTNYSAPIFAILLVLSCLLYCLRIPYHSMIIAAGHFKETEKAAYGETLCNMFLSVLLVSRFGLIGLTFATVLATAFRFLYYVIYLSNNILNRSIKIFTKRFLLDTVIFSTNVVLNNLILSKCLIDDYMKWIVCAIGITLISFIITFSFNRIFYKNEYNIILNYLKKNR